TKIHVEDLIDVERDLGYHYEWPEHPAGHYQHVCPACRRKMLALAQGRLWAAAAPEGGADGRGTAPDTGAAGDFRPAAGVPERVALRYLGRARPPGQDALLLLRAAVRHPAEGEGQRGDRLRALGGLPLQPGHALPQGRAPLPARLPPRP